jgi:ribonuclease HII
MLDKKYPNFGFAKHKGYSTESHIQALKTEGPCRVHRLSYAPVQEAKKILQGDSMSSDRWSA